MLNARSALLPFEVIVAVNVKITVLLGVTPCTLVKKKSEY